MSTYMLRTSLSDYLEVRRALGFKLGRDGILLEQFVDFCEKSNASHITSELATRWVMLPNNPSPSWLAMRLSIVRSFARWLQGFDIATEMPPRDWLPRQRRTVPYLYSDTDITLLMAQAKHIRWPLSAMTYETLIGLLAITGIRVGEAIRLNSNDLSLNEGLMTIRHSKFNKSRMLVLHPSTVTSLKEYIRHRDALSPMPNEQALFVFSMGNRITYQGVQSMFHTLVQRAGLKERSEYCRPTIHGLRHTFAMKTLVGWYKSGVDINPRLMQLSTWLGHSDPKWTYWYLSSTPELLGSSLDRLEAFGERHQ